MLSASSSNARSQSSSANSMASLPEEVASQAYSGQSRPESQGSISSRRSVTDRESEGIPDVLSDLKQIRREAAADELRLRRIREYQDRHRPDEEEEEEEEMEVEWELPTEPSLPTPPPQAPSNFKQYAVYALIAIALLFVLGILVIALQRKKKKDRGGLPSEMPEVMEYRFA